MEQEATPTKGFYFIDVQSAAECARLIEQDQLVRAHTGLFPLPVKDLFPLFGEHEYRVLDLACGPGGWALEVAHQVPSLEVIGVDNAPVMVEYATARAQSQNISNVSFEIMDITKPLTFRDASFQYINARFLVGLMKPDAWPPLVQECTRLLAPGGTLCLTESEWPITNSKAYETLKRMVTQALWVAEQSLSPDGQEFGVTPMLSHFLYEAGYHAIGHKATAMEWSAGTALNTASYYQCQAAFELLRPFVLKMGMATQETYVSLFAQMLDDLCSPSFCAISYPLTVWGQKPGGRHEADEDDN